MLMWFIVCIRLWISIEIYGYNKYMILENKWVAEFWQNRGRIFLNKRVIMVLCYKCKTHTRII